MTPFLSAAAALSALNVLFLVALGVVWARNYWAFRTPLTLGLLGFAVVLAVENLVALSFLFSMGMLYTGSAAAQQAVLAMRALQFVAILFLTAVSMR
ncbi:hypothetical protein [Halobellus sp. EA9]|uniref:hypothetical protein n=1 Tax=Halobellus sp. EA9 TaxID=3421647 RepID=UPI003EBC2266